VRYFLDISYNGTSYYGWQIQKSGPTVQAEIEHALSKLLGEKVGIMGSGRTDAGVHAKQQIAHFDTEKTVDLVWLKFRLNSFLSPNVAVNDVVEVNSEAHTRFDAIERSYEYYIHQQKSPFVQELSYYFPKPLNIDLMNEAASKLLGTQDFESFSRIKTEVNNFICNITKAHWKMENDSLVFHVTANRFLRGMVRALVGTLLEVGLGKLTVEDFIKIIERKDRTAAGRAVPPKGLFLSKVTYPSSVYSN
tara:strand:- start:2887 stop:3633 length:747 start_codon:yes stop_codon:yes gene_type:complete